MHLTSCLVGHGTLTNSIWFNKIIYYWETSILEFRKKFMNLQQRDRVSKQLKTKERGNEVQGGEPRLLTVLTLHKFTQKVSTRSLRVLRLNTYLFFLTLSGMEPQQDRVFWTHRRGVDPLYMAQHIRTICNPGKLLVWNQIQDVWVFNSTKPFLWPLGCILTGNTKQFWLTNTIYWHFDTHKSVDKSVRIQSNQYDARAQTKRCHIIRYYCFSVGYRCGSYDTNFHAQFVEVDELLLLHCKCTICFGWLERTLHI